MNTTMLKLSTMAMGFLAIALGAEPKPPGPELARATAQVEFHRQASQPASWLRPRVPTQTVSPTVPSAFDPVILPGKSVGPITAETSYSDLAKLFGPVRLAEVEVSSDTGPTRAGTKVDLGEERSFTVIWADSARTQIAEVRDLGADWHTPEGIQPGISLAELETILGPFQLSGFAWDHGGTVMLEGTMLDDYESQLTVRLQPTPEDTHQAQALREVLGDELVDSNHKSFDAIYPVVDEIIVSLAKPANSRRYGVW